MKVIIALIIGLFSFALFGQQLGKDHSLTGTVFDAEMHTVLQYITITVQDIETKEIFSVTTTKLGEFKILIPNGIYYLTTTSISFNPFIIQVLKVNQDLDLGIIELKQVFEELNEVEIVAKFNLVDYKSNKKIYNASKDIANLGGNAITVLENTPSVSIDEEGNITIRGTSAKVLVNGKPYGGQEGNADILSLIPANSIQKVEIMSRSAKYDAEGGSILNIILKKGTNDGYNGSIEAHGAIPNNNGVSAFLNYKTDKINLFTTASINKRERIKETFIKQTFLDDNGNPESNFDESRKDNKYRNGLLLNLGTDFYFDEKNTLSTSFLYSSANKNYISNMVLKDYDPIDVLERSATRDVNDNTDDDFFEAYANFTTKFNKKGHKLSILLNYDKNDSKNNTYIFNSETFPGSNSYTQKYYHQQDLKHYYINFDYTLPLSNNTLLEFGHKSNFRFYNNDFMVSNYNMQTTMYEPIPGFFNRINYDECIYAFWATLNKEYENFSYYIGLRSELSQIDINDKINNTNSSDSYNDFFPDILISYSFQNESNLSASYYRDIRRPSIKELNPFSSYTDERFIIVGNPYIKPYYSNSFALEYNQDFEKLSLNLAFYYTKSIDKILQTIEKTGRQTNDGYDIFRRTPRNNGDYSATELEIQLTYSPTKRIRIFGLLNPNYAVIENTKDNLYDYSDIIWKGRINGLFRFTDSFRTQISYNYQSSIKTDITDFGTYQYTSLTIGKDLFNGKATLSFNVDDLFNSKKAKYKSLEANTISNLSFRYETQYLLSFTYRFNYKGKRNAKNRVKDKGKNIFELDD